MITRAPELAVPVDSLTGTRMRPGTLTANVTWTFAGNVVYAVCQWAMLVILAKAGDPSVVGQFVLGTALSAPVFMLTNLHLRGAQATDARGEFAFGDYLGVRLITTAVALLGIGLLVTISGYSGVTAAVIAVVSCGRAFDSVSDVFYGLLQQRERMDAIALPMIVNGLASAALLALGMLLTGSIVWAAIGWSAASAGTLLLNVVRTPLVCRSASRQPARGNSQLSYRPIWSRRTVWRLVLLSLPLGISTLLASLMVNVPRYFIEHSLSAYALGIFVALTSVTMIGATVMSALGQAVSPRLAQYYAADDRASFRTLLLRLVGIGAAFGLGGVLLAIFAGRAVIVRLYSPEYAVDQPLFVWLMVGGGVTFVSSVLGFALTSMRWFRRQVPLMGMALVVLTIACAAWVPSFGLRGAAYALLAAAIAQMAGSASLVAHGLRSRPPA